MKTYNIIGDIHGHHEELKKLLILLGYRENKNGFYHPKNDQALFVGDLINRGPSSKSVLDIVKKMHMNKQARVVLGNHEFNLIQQFFIKPNAIDSTLRKYIDWLRTLPLFLDLPELRIVHAAWHFPSIEKLKHKSCKDDQFIESTLKKGSGLKKAVRAILQGIKINVPDNIQYYDRFKIKRNKARIKWWLKYKNEFDGSSFLPKCEKLVDTKFYSTPEVETSLYPKTEKPVFFGHYCLPPEESKIYDNIICTDGCVTYGRELWAYSFKSTKISKSSLISAKL